MIAPEQISRSGKFAVFMTDPTGDWHWAFDPAGENAIYEGEPHGEWIPVPEAFPEFLTHNTLSEATYNANSWREFGQVEEELLPAVIAPMTEVGFGGWQWPRPGGRIFISEALVAEVRPAMALGAPWKNRPGYFEIRVAASNPTAISYLDEMKSIKWLGLR